MLGMFKKKKVLEFCAPCAGEILPLGETPDVAFSKGMMGEGVCIMPSEDTICAPFDCNVDIFHTMHAIGCSVDDIETIIHIGMNTVELKGQGFKALGAMQGSVKKGAPLLQLDRTFLAQNTETLISPLVVVDKPENAEVQILRDSGTVEMGDPLIRIIYH